MYRRFYQNDELLSGVIVSFMALLICGFLISWKLVGVDTFDTEMIVYIVLGSISGLVLLLMFILFLVGNRKPFIDIEIDFKQETISVFNRLKTYSFEDVKLYSYNKRHHQVRFFIKKRLVGFSLETLLDKQEQPLTQELAETIGKYGIIVQPKKLYNYHLLISLVWVGLFVMYAFMSSQQTLLLFGKWAIPTYYVLALTVVLIGLTIVVNMVRMNRLYLKKLSSVLSAGEN